jgi:hypothetical protein
MVLFRAEGEIDASCEARGVRRGGTMSLPQLERLARAWYGNRLDADWRPCTSQESQRILRDAGLLGDFWRLA